MSDCHSTALEHDRLMLAVKGPVVLLPPTSRSSLGFCFNTGRGRSPRSLFLLHVSLPFPFQVLDVLQEWPQMIVAAKLNLQKTSTLIPLTHIIWNWELLHHHE